MADDDNVTSLDEKRQEVTPNFKGGAKKAPAAKKGATKKAPAAKKGAAAKKAPPAKKASGVARTASTVSKEGTKKDAFTGETLPVTQFPTVRQKDGTYDRGPVARKNLQAWRESKKAEREAAKAAAAKAKAEKAKKG